MPAAPDGDARLAPYRDVRDADLRGAFMKAMADRELNAEADKMKISIIPMAGPEVQVLIGRLAATPDDLKAKIIEDFT